ncbi:MAG TPA: M1 family metallopeptidase, partial [Candidatus Limnocylindria bacterium]|nr:M1 family metallopeptidase [Candidatus Limnocylindria bacterium]
MNDFRLRKDVRPSRYELRFELDLDRWTSKGTGAITLRTDRPARELVLHSVDLDITSASLDGTAMTGVSYDAESQTATLAFPGEQAPGEHVLRLEWTGEIREALRGLYRSTRGEERYAATQFEAADARRALPCFDEPEFKARWIIELEHDSSLVAISNAPIAEQREVRPGRTLTRFAETPKISSYLVAFCVGPFEPTPVAKSASGSDVRVWLPPGLAVRGVYARDAHVRALGYLEEYTGIPYPYAPKVDAIGLPDFEAGAMENPGAITYRTTYLAVDERTASSAAFKGCFSVAAHELTHMWWGDLVTMAWWTDLWLNESFASFVGEKATTSLNPEWGYERDVVSQNTSAFNLDALVSTHPISVEAKNADEASERFDAVTYLKGQGVLRMIENFIGADAFRAGVRIYLDRHREANATASAFWRALDEASRKDVSTIADAWIHEPGHPLVTCTTREAAGALEIELRQSRFFADPAQRDTGQRWPVPVVIRYGTDGGGRDHRVLLESASQTVRLEGARWYYPNARGTGFYRTALDDRAVALLAQNIGSLAPEERLALLDNQWALARAHKAGVAQVLELVAGLGGEDDRYVLALLAEILGWLSTHAVTDATRDPFRRTVDRLFRPQLERLGWDVRQDDTADEREKRAIVISSLG